MNECVGEKIYVIPIFRHYERKAGGNILKNLVTEKKLVINILIRSINHI